MRTLLALLLLSCAGAPQGHAPAEAKPIAIEWVRVSPDWVEPFIAADSPEYRAWAADPANAKLIAQVRHILVRAKEDTQIPEAQKRVDALIARIKGGEDFAAVASRESEDGSKIRGGALGADTSKFVEPFRLAADKLAPGEMTQVRTQFGIHIIKKDPINAETTAAAWKRERKIPLAKAIAADILVRRANVSMDAAIDGALDAALPAAVKDKDKPKAETFDAAMEQDALAACRDRKEQVRRIMERAHGASLLLCGEMHSIARFSANAARGATLTLPVPPNDTDPIVVYAH
jgi:hypothetical protein